MERLSFLHIEHAASRHAFALGGLVRLGSGLIDMSQKVTVAARVMAARKV
jgi:hypothetical protein